MPKQSHSAIVTLSLSLSLIFLLVAPFFALADETLTITTYYPSPYGSYNELRTYSNTYLAISGGSVGIGTTSPGTKLEVAGDAKITGGLKPDYDSGWYADEASTNHKTTKTHNLGVIPSRIQFWFSPDNPPSNWVYPVSVYGMSVNQAVNSSYGYRVPEGIRVNTTTLEYWAYSDTYMYSYYDSVTATWVVWDSGYYRVQMWK